MQQIATLTLPAHTGKNAIWTMESRTKKITFEIIEKYLDLEEKPDRET
jgi:hypothetical protein